MAHAVGDSRKGRCGDDEKVFEIKAKQINNQMALQTNVESAHRTATTKVITQLTRHDIDKATAAR